jgi:hypothetical protein
MPVALIFPPLPCRIRRQEVDLKTYMDESDYFYKNPPVFFQSLMEPEPNHPEKYHGSVSWPGHFVLFEALDTRVLRMIEEAGYHRVS